MLVSQQKIIVAALHPICVLYIYLVHYFFKERKSNCQWRLPCYWNCSEFYTFIHAKKVVSVQFFWHTHWILRIQKLFEESCYVHKTGLIKRWPVLLLSCFFFNLEIYLLLTFWAQRCSWVSWHLWSIMYIFNV